MKPLFSFMLLLLISCAGSAPAGVIERVPYELFALSNGLRVIVHTQRGTPLVTLHAFVKTGAALEDDFLGRGISHFVEHIVFGASTRRSEQEIKALARGLGDTHNAYTSEDQTCFHMTTLTNQWPVMADVIADQLYRYTFSTNEVQREQHVIVQEIKMGEEDPDDVLWQLLTQTAYYVSPLRVPVTGHCAAFESLSRADVQRYYRERYVANNMTVVVVGPLTRAEIEPVLECTFGGIKPGREWPRAIPAEPPVRAPRTAVKEANVKEYKGCLAFPTVSGLHPDAQALDLLAKLLGQGELAPLVQRVQNEQRVVTDVATFSWTPSLGQGLFIIDYACEPGGETGAVAAIVAECMAARDKAFAPADVARIQRGFALDYARTLQSVEGVAGLLGGSDVAAGDPDSGTRMSQQFMQLTVSDVLAVARVYLQTNAQISVAVRPRALAPTQASARAADAAADETNTITRLANGVRVVLRPSHAAQLVAASVYLPGGVLAETPTNNGISTLLARMLTKGTATRTADELAQAIEARGAALHYEARRDGIAGDLECTPADLPALLDVLADTLLRATFSTNKLENERRVQLSEIRTARDQWQVEAMLDFRANFFAGSAYAMPLSGTSGVVARITQAELAAFHRALLQPSNIVIAIAGAVNPAAVLKQCTALFAALPTPSLRSSIPSFLHSSILPSLHTSALIAAPRAQATVMLGYPAPLAGTPMYPALLLLNSYLGGLSGKLFDVLRGGNADLVYVVYADVLSDTHAGGLIALAQCLPDNAALVRQKMAVAIDELCRQPLEPQIVNDAKTALAVSLATQQQSPAAQAAQAVVSEYRGVGAWYADALPQAVQYLTPADVQRCAQLYFTGMTSVIITPHAPVQRAAAFLERFPRATAQDVYKMLYQGICGPGHLAQAGAALQDELTNEWQHITPTNETLWLPIGITDDWAWFNLRAWKARGGALEPVAKAMWQSVHAAHADPAAVSQAWQHVVAAVADGSVPLTHADVQAFDTFVRSNNYPVVHHTPAFIKEYQPAYRVLSRRLFQTPRVGKVTRANP
ncbi:MAG: pitrilysin family protein [bacterium]|nr:pitrilysin family protein [bacterium]